MKRHVLVTGGAGFIGSHVAERFARRGDDVTVYDNLSRGVLLHKEDAPGASFNWDYLGRYANVRRVRGDVRDREATVAVCAAADVIVHAAAQTAVTTSVTDPVPDFDTNLGGTFNVLEGARLSGRKPALVYCSTNKVYGDNVNGVGILEEGKRYRFEDRFASGLSESFPIDGCEHTPYGCSKLGGDLYMQDYARLFGLRTGVFRMSCIYGTRQFGLEDQGWVAWFVIAALTGRPITIFGDGKQVRDVLYVDDLVDAYEAFLDSGRPHGLYNMGGGSTNTLSLHELLDLLEAETGVRPPVAYADWRPSDQKVYVSDVGRAGHELGWAPRTSPRDGVSRLIGWVRENLEIFKP
jgi:CDP-paratose 2-epimerase